METKDYEDAKKDLQAAQKLDPEDKLKLNVSATLAKCQALIEAEKKKQQKAFGRMFGKSDDGSDEGDKSSDKSSAQ
jgi:hypothetical protein